MYIVKSVVDNTQSCAVSIFFSKVVYIEKSAMDNNTHSWAVSIFYVCQRLCIYIIVKSVVDNTHSWAVSIFYVCQRLCIYSEVGCGQHTRLGS